MKKDPEYDNRDIAAMGFGFAKFQIPVPNEITSKELTLSSRKDDSLEMSKRLMTKSFTNLRQSAEQALQENRQQAR